MYHGSRTPVEPPWPSQRLIVKGCAGARSSPLVLATDYGERKFLHRVDAAISNDGHERHSLVQEVVRRLQRILSGGFRDLYDPLRFTGLALHNENHLPCLSAPPKSRF